MKLERTTKLTLTKKEKRILGEFYEEVLDHRDSYGSVDMEELLCSIYYDSRRDSENEIEICTEDDNEED